MTRQRIGILGSGDVGQKLGTGFAALGHEVKLGAREATNEKTAAWAKKTGSGASAGSFNDAAKFGDIVVVATLWGGTENALTLAGQENLAGKVVLDVTNPLETSASGLRLALGHTDSGGEQVQRWLPKSKVVKTFNTVGNAHFFKPKFERAPTMFFAGNYAEAKKVAAAIITEFGWEALDCGGIEASRLLEPLCILWVGHGARSGTWNHAFKLLTK